MIHDELEFQEIHDVFRPKIQRYLTRLVGADEANDLTQEVFLKVSSGLKDFRGESQLSTWIYRIATNAALDRLRNPSLCEETKNSVTEGKMGTENMSLEIKELVPLADHQLIRKEMDQCIRNVISKLPQDYRVIIVLSDLEELKNREIAKILGVTLDAVKIRVHRARARLKKELEAHCTFYRDEHNRDGQDSPR